MKRKPIPVFWHVHADIERPGLHNPQLRAVVKARNVNEALEQGQQAFQRSLHWRNFTLASACVAI